LRGYGFSRDQPQTVSVSLSTRFAFAIFCGECCPDQSGYKQNTDNCHTITGLHGCNFITFLKKLKPISEVRLSEIKWDHS
jgi:hypothetical protein